MKNKPLLYLASRSPRRRVILQRLRIPFKIVKTTYREHHRKRISPRQLVQQHACGKVMSARVPTSASYVLGADTIVVHGKQIIGKPKSMWDAQKILKSLSGCSHQVLTAVALADIQNRHVYVRVVSSYVRMKPMSEKEIIKYLRKINPLDKAGAYGVQTPPSIIKSIKGSRSNVAGLPKKVVFNMWKYLCMGKVAKLKGRLKWKFAGKLNLV